MKKHEKTRMTLKDWEKYEREVFMFYRKHGVEGEDIDLTPEDCGVEIVPSQEEKEQFWEER